MTDEASTDCDDAVPDRVGILAGWGSFPVELAEHYRSHGAQVHVVAIKGHAAPELENLSDSLRWTGVLKIGAGLKYFESKSVRHVAFAGKVFKDRILYHGRGWIEHMPDFTCYRLLGSSFITRRTDGRDDTILNAIMEEYRRRGIEVLPITKTAKHLLASEGCLTQRRISRAQRRDIDFGWQIARQMGGLDIGQSITVKDQIVLGVEAIEGTDALVTRTATICPRGGFTLVKVAKPNQDMRFDVPTIGPQTIERLARAGGSAVAIEAGKTIVVELTKTVELANKLGISIVVQPAEASKSEIARDAAAATPKASCTDLIVANQRPSSSRTQVQSASSRAA
ncbi:MAG TPA: DUF1009 domain-containing protein [Planctomycetaceae bacterium]|nr:DUF1009 domain-containing protein [Planctomycetaceae bacterium]